MMNDPLHYLSADEALTLFASRALSPVELMEAVIHRAEEVQDTVNAFTFTHYDEAMDLARAAEEAKTISPDALLDCYEAIGHMYTTLGPVLERCDILICPTTGIPAVPADFDQTRDKLVINGREVEPPFGWTLTLPFNMLSRCPVISVPTGHAANGVPTGMQIVGRTYGDASVVRAAAAYERALSGWLQIGAEGPNFRNGVPA